MVNRCTARPRGDGSVRLSHRFLVARSRPSVLLPYAEYSTEDCTELPTMITSLPRQLFRAFALKFHNADQTGQDRNARAGAGRRGGRGGERGPAHHHIISINHHGWTWSDRRPLVTEDGGRESDPQGRQRCRPPPLQYHVQLVDRASIFGFFDGIESFELCVQICRAFHRRRNMHLDG